MIWLSPFEFECGVPPEDGRESWSPRGATAQDEREGQPAQPVTDFVLEAFLKRHGTREQAEHALFTLVRSVKEHRRHHCLVHTFARALGLLVDRAAEARGEGEKPRKADEKITDHIKITNAPLEPMFITAYLFARRLLLRRPLLAPRSVQRPLAASSASTTRGSIEYSTRTAPSCTKGSQFFWMGSASGCGSGASVGQFSTRSGSCWSDDDDDDESAEPIEGGSLTRCIRNRRQSPVHADTSSHGSPAGLQKGRGSSGPEKVPRTPPPALTQWLAWHASPSVRKSSVAARRMRPRDRRPTAAPM